MASYLILFAVVAASAIAHILLKMGMNQVGEVGLEQVRNPARLAASLLTTPAIIPAVLIYVLSFVGWVLVLSRLQLSLAYPALALTYVLIPLAAWAILSEPVSRTQWAGVLLVALGIALTVRGGVA